MTASSDAVQRSPALTTSMFGLEYINSLVEKSHTSQAFQELRDDAGDPYETFSSIDSPSKDAGYLRLWQGTGSSLIDRMIHFRLRRDPVDTQLFFLFGKSATPMPHFHAQIVQFGPDACIFNADYLPRLDPVDHPDYFTEVFAPLTKVYQQAIKGKDSVCGLAPPDPAVAACLSPWRIACGRPASREELDRNLPLIDEFLINYLRLAGSLAYTGAPPDYLRERDRRHLELFFDDQLDPRAWRGVYNVIGEDAGRRVKNIFMTQRRG